MITRNRIALLLVALAPLATASHAEAADAKGWLKSFFAAVTGDDDGDEDEGADNARPCISAADGKHGTNNSAGRNSGNGGSGGTIRLGAGRSSGDCASANGGNGGSWNWGRGNNRTGNGGKGGKITF